MGEVCSRGGVGENGRAVKEMREEKIKILSRRVKGPLSHTIKRSTRTGKEGERESVGKGKLRATAWRKLLISKSVRRFFFVCRRGRRVAACGHWRQLGVLCFAGGIFY